MKLAALWNAETVLSFVALVRFQCVTEKHAKDATLELAQAFKFLKKRYLFSKWEKECGNA